MLEHTFCHLPGIGPTSEAKLWQQGINRWQQALQAGFTGKRAQTAIPLINESILRLQAHDVSFFAAALPPREHWRLFPHFQQRIAYLDIETTGLCAPFDHVTTIALYDGRDIHTYIHGQNLDQFADDITRYDLLVTFNGKSFDLPFLRKSLHLPMQQAHIDLMHVMRSLGYRGGLKAIERKLGYDRPDMQDVDGFMAVLLWQRYEQTGEPEVLETLLAYNIQDVITLEQLMTFAFNARLATTPFLPELQLASPPLAANPCRAHREVVDTFRTAPYEYWR